MEQTGAMTGTIKIWSGIRAPAGWLLCDGSLLQITNYRALFNAIGATYGGDGQTTFAVPDLAGRIPIGAGSGSGLTPRVVGQQGGAETVALINDNAASHSHSLGATDAAATSRTPAAGLLPAESQGRIYGSGPANAMMAPAAMSEVGTGAPHENMQPSLSINHIICFDGFDPAVGDGGFPEPFLGEIAISAGNYVWKNWAPCEGQVIQISGGINDALFSIMGTVFGGNGIATFALPDLRGRAAMAAGYSSGLGISDRFIGDTAGTANVTLTADNLPSHRHSVFGTSSSGLSNDPAGLLFAAPFSGDNLYAPISAATLAPMAVVQANAGGQPHPNMQPYLPLMFLIAMFGIYPEMQ